MDISPRVFLLWARRGVITVVLGVLALGLACRGAGADFPPAPTGTATALAKIVKKYQIPDLQAAMMKDGQIAWALTSAGPLTTKATNETRFRIGSVSKCITALALLKMVEAHEIALDTPIAQLGFPNFPEAQVITPRLLAGHLAGIHHYLAGQMVNKTHYESVTAGLAIFDRDSLLAQPGTKFIYSSYGFNLLGAVMEHEAKKPFAEVIEADVIKPLGMTHTAPDTTKADPANARLFGYNVAGQASELPRSDDYFKLPSGGIVSTASDMVRLGSGAFRPGYLSPEDQQLLRTGQTLPKGGKTAYSLGFVVAHNAQGGVLLQHSGASIGGCSFLLVAPDRQACFAVVMNLRSDEAIGELAQIGRDLIGTGDATVSPLKPEEKSPE